jgi:hypothetical protein
MSAPTRSEQELHLRLIVKTKNGKHASIAGSRHFDDFDGDQAHVYPCCR